MARLLKDVVAYLDERLGAHTGRGPEYQWHCPACINRLGDESSQRKLGINIKTKKGGCFRCSWAFRDFGQLFRYLNGGVIRMEEMAFLRHEVEIPSKDFRIAVRGLLYHPKTIVRLMPQSLPREFVLLDDLWLKEQLLPQYRVAFKYLRGRGATEEKIREYNIGYCASGKYAQYLIFPVIQGGAVVYFTSRFCGDSAMKSKNPENEEGRHQRATCLLNYDNCVGQKRVFVVEGPFSCMAMDPGLALMGKVISEQQVELIAALVPQGLEELVVVLDPGAGSQADAVYHALLGRVPRVRMLPLDGGDPDDLKADMPALVRQARVPTVADRVRQRLNG